MSGASQDQLIVVYIHSLLQQQCCVRSLSLRAAHGVVIATQQCCSSSQSQNESLPQQRDAVP